ncbi:MAG: hypothetical protein R2695_00275 [Acidimicrobiales bacterium]
MVPHRRHRGARRRRLPVRRRPVEGHDHLRWREHRRLRGGACPLRAPRRAEAAVVGRPDERWGEVPVAFVAVRAGATVGEDELVEHCRANLAKFKVPKAVTFVDALPRNPSGKVLKRELRTGR